MKHDNNTTRHKVNKVYKRVTDQIIAALRAGEIPWHKPWRAHRNAITGREYRGFNILVLNHVATKHEYKSNQWISYKKAKAHGGQVRKGESGTAVIYWKWVKPRIKGTNRIDETAKPFPIPFYHTVFNLDQCNWLDDKHPFGDDEQREHEPIDEAQQVIDNMPDRPELKHGGGRAYYAPMDDRVQMPPAETFTSGELYYSVFFHELAHSTGHPKRLGRLDLSRMIAPFGSEDYSQEELVAEMTAAMLCGVTGIEADQTRDNSAAYIQSWLEVFQNDERFVIYAAQSAQKAADFILDRQHEDK